MCVKQFAQRGLCVVEKAGVDSHPRDGTVQRSFALESGDRTRTNSVVGVEPQIRVRGEVLEFVSLDRPVFETCDAIGGDIGQTLTDCAIQNGLLKSAARLRLEYRFLSFKLSATVISRLVPSLDSIAELLR